MLTKINNIKPNPRNPRLIRDSRFESLCTSLREFPEMLEKRPLVCFTDSDGKFVVLGGNMRLKAAKEIGLKELPIMLADDWTAEQKDQFLIKDNLNFGEFNFDELQADWNVEQLESWGLDVPEFEDGLTNNESYEGLDQLSKLEKFMDSELKRMFLVFDNTTFENVVNWFNKKQNDFDVKDNSLVILKLMENEII